jgi:hypothetical protein
VGDEHESRGIYRIHRTRRAASWAVSSARSAVVGRKRKLESLARVSGRAGNTRGYGCYAYLHHKEGNISKADYWYERAGRRFHRPTWDAEWQALVAGLLASGNPNT